MKKCVSSCYGSRKIQERNDLWMDYVLRVRQIAAECRLFEAENKALIEKLNR